MHDKLTNDPLYLEALTYHQQHNQPGKLQITTTKPLETQHDLALAYSPGVAAPCLAIHQHVDQIYKYTARGNMVAVISNGTAVLGLGNIGAAAASPVMEGKAALFKKFADIDAVPLLINTEKIDEFILAVKHLNYSFGGINLEDIKAPDCFIIESQLQELMDIPIFHDDQHGTAITVLAGIINAAHITGKRFTELKLVVNGAGAASIACVNLLKKAGIKSENIVLCDTQGVIYHGRAQGMNPWKAEHATYRQIRTLEEAIIGADIFLGLSTKGVLSRDMVAVMNMQPIIFALANPEPEIIPPEVYAVRCDAIVATGRSDYLNQINNVMCFPYIFRGALDVRARKITDHMKFAVAENLALLARQSIPSEVVSAYAGRKMQYGPEYIIPTPFDPRLLTNIATAAAQAAIDSGVARIESLEQIQRKQHYMSWQGNNKLPIAMLNTIDRLKQQRYRIIFAHSAYNLKTISILQEQGIRNLLLIGNLAEIQQSLAKAEITLDLAKVRIIDPSMSEELIKQYADYLYLRLQRLGYMMQDCIRLLKTNYDIFAACLAIHQGGDLLVAGPGISYRDCLANLTKAIDSQATHIFLTYHLVNFKNYQLLLVSNEGGYDSSPQGVLNFANQVAKLAKAYKLEPRIAFIGGGNFGEEPAEQLASTALQVLRDTRLAFEVDGLMTIKAALAKNLKYLYPFCRLSAAANVLILPKGMNTTIVSDMLSNLLDEVNSVTGPLLDGSSIPFQIVRKQDEAIEILTSICATVLKLF